MPSRASSLIHSDSGCVRPEDVRTGRDGRMDDLVAQLMDITRQSLRRAAITGGRQAWSHHLSDDTALNTVRRRGDLCDPACRARRRSLRMVRTTRRPSLQALRLLTP